MVTENKDVNIIILKKLESDDDVFNFSMINKFSAAACRNEMFWKGRFFDKFPDYETLVVGNHQYMKYDTFTWKNRCLIYQYYKNKYLHSKMLYKLAGKGVWTVFFYFYYENNGSFYDEAVKVGATVHGAIKTRNVEMFKNIFFGNSRLMMENASTAAKYYKKEIVDIMLERYNNEIVSRMLFGAAKAGNMTLVRRIAYMNNKVHLINGFWGACRGGNMEMVKYFTEVHRIRDMNGGLRYSALGGSRELVDFFIDKGAGDFRSALYASARKGHLELLKFFIENVGTFSTNKVFEEAITGGHVHILEYLIQNYSKPIYLDVDERASGKIEVINFLIKNDIEAA